MVEERVGAREPVDTGLEEDRHRDEPVRREMLEEELVARVRVPVAVHDHDQRVVRRAALICAAEVAPAASAGKRTSASRANVRFTVANAPGVA